MFPKSKFPFDHHDLPVQMVSFQFSVASHRLINHDVLMEISIFCKFLNQWQRSSDVLNPKKLETHWLFGPQKISFHYWRAPRGPRGVKNHILFFLKWNCFPFALRLPLKDTNFKNYQNWRKNVKKNPVSFSNILQFGGNLSAPNLNWHV